MVRLHSAYIRSIVTDAQGHLSSRKALLDFYSWIFGRDVGRERQMGVIERASEGVIAILMVFVDSSDDVVVMELVFDLY